MATITTTFVQLVAAFFVAFILAHATTKYLDRFERFPSPLVTPGSDLPGVVQGRDYVPHRFKPTVPPGPPTPEPRDSDPAAFETTPPSPRPTMMQGATRTPNLPYAMTSDDYLSFLTPEKTMGMSVNMGGGCGMGGGMGDGMGGGGMV